MTLLPDRRLRFELRELLLVAVGAAPGALLRWQAAVQLAPAVGGEAITNLIVNLLGSFVLGFLAGPIPRRTALVLCLGIGFCGSLTTFCSWMFDVLRLLQAGARQTGIALLVSTLLLGLIAAWAGLRCSRAYFRPPRS